MGSDLAHLLHPLGALPPFRNASPGPPDRLPRLAQLTASFPLSSSSSSSWTAVNHPSQSESTNIDTRQDRARGPLVVDNHTNHHHHHHTVSSAPAPHQPHPENHHSPLRPNSTSHLGRRIHQPRLVPKRPISPSRQDSATPESPSPKVPSDLSPEASQAVLPKETPLIPHPFVTSKLLATSPAVDSSLGPSRAAIPLLTPLHQTPDREREREHGQNLHLEDENHQYLTNPHPSSTTDGHESAKPPTRTTRRPSTLLRNFSVPAPITASLFPTPRSPSQRRARRVSSIDTHAIGTFPDIQAPVPVNSSTHMIPPLVPYRNANSLANADSTSHQGAPTPLARAIVSAQVSEAQLAMLGANDTATTLDSDSIAPIISNGHVTRTVNGESRPELSSTSINPAMNPAELRDSKTTTRPTSDQVLRCQICGHVYPPQSLQRALSRLQTSEAHSVEDLNQNADRIISLLREHRGALDSNPDEWLERHRHDSDNIDIVLQAVTSPELLYTASHSNKRKRSPAGDGLSNDKKYYPFHSTSGDPMLVSEEVARLFPGDGVPREPYVAPPKTKDNMWYIPPDEPEHDKKRRNDGRKKTDASQSQSHATREDQPEERETSPPHQSRKSPGAAPLNQILHP